MYRNVLVTSCAVVAGLLCSLATADAAPNRIDPNVFRAIDTGVLGPHLRPAPTRTTALAPVVVELVSPATPSVLQKIAATGARLRNLQGRTLSYRRFVPADVTRSAVEALAKMPEVRSISLAPIAGLRPMDNSAALIDLEAARGARPDLDMLTGEGIVVADLDTNADVFHPQFFRADAGYFDWIDTNGSGKFEPGTDAIDLDRDGSAGPQETAIALKAATLFPFYGDPVNGRPAQFDPGLDWIYLDTNDNGVRDYGSAKGFDDATPAMGEPLFVPDDLNRNGKLDPGERLARLGTSKFRKLYVHIIKEYSQSGKVIDHVFERGVDLATHVNQYTADAHGYGDALHGTGVLSIIAGDVPLVGRRWVGVAPDADLLLGYELAADTMNSVTWALNESPDVVLHETANWYGVPMDGSDPYSKVVDESIINDSVTHTCPMGNLGGSRKHARVVVPPGGSATPTFEVPGIGAYYVGMSLNVRGGTGVTAQLLEPNGTSHVLRNGYYNLSNGSELYVTENQVSERGTRLFDVILYSRNTLTKPIPVGTYQVAISGHPTLEATIDGFLVDDVSGWSQGAAWDAAIASDDSTTGVPAVSDYCIAVGALVGHVKTASEPWFAYEGNAGEVRDYSGRGPRIDGMQKPDVIAPDNPWVAAPQGKGMQGAIVPHGAVWPFGGTSGATPHVTGVTALLAQAGIRANDARDALRSGAQSDAITGTVPNKDYGWGRMSAAAALGVAADGERPEVTLTATPARVPVGGEVEIAVDVVNPGGEASEVELRWDDGYDGTWDGAYAPVSARTVAHDAAGRYPYKARVRNAQGRVAEAVVWVEVGDAPVEDAGVDADPGADAGVDAEPAADGSVPGSDASVPGDDASTEGPDAATQPSEQPVASDDDDGCGCRTAGSSSRAWPLAAALMAAAWGLRRSRKAPRIN